MRVKAVFAGILGECCLKIQGLAQSDPLLFFSSGVFLCACWGEAAQGTPRLLMHLALWALLGWMPASAEGALRLAEPCGRGEEPAGSLVDR